MSECKDERVGIGGNPSQPSFKIPLGSIKSIIQMIKCAFEVPEIPLPPISADEIALGMQNRPGMSKQDTTARVLNKKNKSGIPSGPNNDGSTNLSNIKDRIIVEEIMDELMYKSKIEVIIPRGNLSLNAPLDINLTGYAGFTVQGNITNKVENIKAEGIIR